MRPNSIRARMTRSFAAYTALLMVLVCCAFFNYARRSDRKRTDVALAAISVDIEQVIKRHPGRYIEPQQLIHEEIEDWRAADIAVFFVDRKGRIVARSQTTLPPWPLRDDSWRVRQIAAPGMTIVAAKPWQRTENEERQRALLLLVLCMAVVAASAGGAWVLVGRTLQPIDALTAQALEASTDNLHVRLAAPSPDGEIERLVATFNGVLARLEETSSQRGYFYAAASHELRTPLQALTGHLEVSLSRRRNADEYREALGEAHRQAERLSSLVQELLLLNQIETGVSRPGGLPLDLADICHAEIERVRAEAQARGLELALALPTGYEIVGVWNHVIMLVRNLLENAVKYATPGGTVSLKLASDSLVIINDFSGGEEMDAEKLMRPFYRPDASRNSQIGGNGLGLTICKAVCDANGWSLQVVSDKGQVAVEVAFR
jgi:signal transduction histidine kinase